MSSTCPSYPPGTAAPAVLALTPHERSPPYRPPARPPRLLEAAARQEPSCRPAIQPHSEAQTVSEPAMGSYGRILLAGRATPLRGAEKLWGYAEKNYKSPLN